MIFPVPIPMYYPYSSGLSCGSPTNMRGVESKLGDVTSAIKEMSAKLDKKDICISTDTDSIREVMAFVGPHVEREASAFEERSKIAWRRIHKIDDWKYAREKRRKEQKKEEADLWNEALKQDAEFNYRNQPKGKWWKGWVEKPYSSYLSESGYKEPKKKKSDPFGLDRHMELYESIYGYEASSLRHRFRTSDVDRIARKPFWIEHKDQLMKLWQICEQIRGATLQVPSELMQMVAMIVKDADVQIQQGHRCGSCGSFDFIADQGRKVCGYCRIPKGA